FQAEDGIRARNVTGVQTCALPISGRAAHRVLLLLREPVLPVRPRGRRRGRPAGRAAAHHRPPAAAGHLRAGAAPAAGARLHRADLRPGAVRRCRRRALRDAHRPGGQAAVRRRLARLRHPVLRYVLRRLVQALIVLWGAVTVSFAVLQLTPGDPVRIMLGGAGDAAAAASPEQVAALRTELGLDLPLWQQYLDFLGRVLSGDFGTAYSTGQPVTAEITQALPVTVELGVAAIATSVVAALV